MDDAMQVADFHDATFCRWLGPHIGERIQRDRGETNPPRPKMRSQFVHTKSALLATVENSFDVSPGIITHSPG